MPLCERTLLRPNTKRPTIKAHLGTMGKFKNWGLHDNEELFKCTLRRGNDTVVVLKKKALAQQ